MPLSFNPIEWTAFSGQKFSGRVYEGKHVALIVPEHFFSTNYVPEPNTVKALGPWPGVADSDLELLIRWLDSGFEFYRDFTGITPKQNSAYPAKSPVWFVSPEITMDAAGLGLIGTQGIQIGPAFFDYSIYAARKGQIIETIFWHELGRNFSVGAGSTTWDPGVKYVLTEELSVPTFMHFYTKTYDEFLLDQNYQLPRYFLADDSAVWATAVNSPYPKPDIPDFLQSASLRNSYNGGDLRPALTWQFYLENGYAAWEEFAKWLFLTDLSNDNLNDQTQIVEKMNAVSGRFDYTFVFKTGWQIVDHILAPRARDEAFVVANKSVYLGSRFEDIIRMEAGPQSRVDGGDGFDTLHVDLPFSKIHREAIQKWVYSFSTTDGTCHVSASNVERVIFSDGVVKELNQEYDALGLMVNSVQPELDASGRLWVNISFSEAIKKH
ncbi:MAG: hypothetical protein EB072_14315, partial [Betaproteobacteria bacterium]|nr:hypothetical protein [Betaproteobacteria bacterium]